MNLPQATTRESTVQAANDIFDRGIYKLTRYDRVQAIIDFTSAIELDPEYITAYIARGYTYYEKGELDQAIADYTEVIRRSPEHAHAYDLRGRAYTDLGEESKAKGDFALAQRSETDQRIKMNRREDDTR